MRYLTAEELLFLHFKIIEDYGGSHGVRDEGRIQSVIASPASEAFGEALYATGFEKAAVYVRNVVADHPFVDGNKRTAIAAGVIFLQRCGYEMTATPKELEDFAVQAAVERLEIPMIAAWLKAHSSKTKKLAS